ncbi:T9SS type B sorting domain-containing protein [Dyadobacter sp. OTU695]|uniref:T9SS type B sorting domain-containing protein n=1 Tax=Dyadobacter sp. OTU695 TaxID=3043860 RepID=UPI00313D96DD
MILTTGAGKSDEVITVGDLDWANGYNDQNQVQGTPGLTINENTGEITIKADEAGQYLIGISVEEYRNGRKIGSVNFYYTLTVLDCNEQQVLDKSIYKDTTSIQTLTICQGSEAILSSKQTFPDPQPEFQWTRNGKTIWGANEQSITISEAGEYQLLTSKIDGCPDSFESEAVRVSVISSGAEMDSIPPICDTTLSIALHATPPGGTFEGTGVTGSTFDPKIAGEGMHDIQYVIEGSEAWPAAVAKREVVVSQAPRLDLLDVLYTSRDKPILIGVKDSLNVAYRWTPPDYLNDVTYANPISTPSADITYTVTATNAYGCVGRREVKVKITESILIPDAFTPNKDGINEIWELKGIEGYPKCHVTIYNRWGEVIFHSIGYQNAFDGTVSGALQMPGVYAYKIRLTEHGPELTGSLMLIH